MPVPQLFLPLFPAAVHCGTLQGARDKYFLVSCSIGCAQCGQSLSLKTGWERALKSSLGPSCSMVKSHVPNFKP